MTRVHHIACLLILITGSPMYTSMAEPARETAARITAAALASNHGEQGRPLPLASHWCSGKHPFSAGWQLGMQLSLIEEGYMILPWMSHPEATENAFTEGQEGWIRRLAELNLPLVLVSSQWERLLSAPPFIELPAAGNPNVVGTDGEIQRRVSPFGPVAPWQEVGRGYTENPGMRLLQELYPTPPLVIFLSNNEHAKLRWHQVESSSRYMEQYGPDRADDFKREVVAKGWIERYRALQGSMRDGLASDAWRQAARFVGYDAFGLEFMGRWGGWKNYSLMTDDWIDPSPLIWDGGSPSYYLHHWNPTTDFNTWSPHIEFMNTVFMQQEAWRLNPEFWIELSVWDGHDHPGNRPAPANDKRRFYQHQGQDWTPVRYAGFTQFGMWLMRPRALREYRGWTFRYEEGEPWWMAIVQAVDRVHHSAELADWWRHGELVPNTARTHPWQTNLPERYKEEERWFLLDCDRNPSEYPWESFWQVKVFALALVQGQAPERRWLIYAHAPQGLLEGVSVTVPGQAAVTLDASVDGAYYELAEASGTLRRIRVRPIEIPTPEPGECLHELTP